MATAHFEYVRPHSPSGLITLSDAERIASSLRHGSLAILPTETGYMLAALATSVTAIERAFAVKRRDAANVMHVACSSTPMAAAIGNVNPRAQALLGALTPGPVTVIVEKTPVLPDRLVTLNGTVGIRIPDHPATLQVISAVGAPLTATSLNESGADPALIGEADLGLLAWPPGEIVYVVQDDSAIRYSSPSTLVRVVGPEVEILRAGPVSRPELERVAGLSGAVSG